MVSSLKKQEQDSRERSVKPIAGTASSKGNPETDHNAQETRETLSNSEVAMKDGKFEIKVEGKQTISEEIFNNLNSESNNNSICNSNQRSGKEPGTYFVKKIIKSEKSERITLRLKRSQKRKQMKLVECEECQKFFTAKYIKDHKRRVHGNKKDLNI